MALSPKRGRRPQGAVSANGWFAHLAQSRQKLTKNSEGRVDSF